MQPTLVMEVNARNASISRIARLRCAEGRGMRRPAAVGKGVRRLVAGRGDRERRLDDAMPACLPISADSPDDHHTYHSAPTCHAASTRRPDDPDTTREEGKGRDRRRRGRNCRLNAGATSRQSTHRSRVAALHCCAPPPRCRPTRTARLQHGLGWHRGQRNARTRIIADTPHPPP